MAITITFFVYIFALSGKMGLEQYKVSNIVSHIILPLLVMSDYVFFGEKGKLQKKFVFLWSIPLIIYQFFVILYSHLGGTFAGQKYPYPYMNIEQYGVIGVFINCLVIYIFFIGYGTIIQSLDNAISKKYKKAGSK